MVGMGQICPPIHWELTMKAEVSLAPAGNKHSGLHSRGLGVGNQLTQALCHKSWQEGILGGDSWSELIVSDQGIRHGITKPSVLVTAIAQQVWEASLVVKSPNQTASLKDQQQALSSLQVRGQMSGVSTRDGPGLTEFTDAMAVLQIGMTLWHDGSS